MIVDFFLRLLLGHLVGDFVMQPLWLALAKRGGWRGLTMHVAVVTLVSAAMIWKIIPYWWLWIIVLFFVHLFIDQFRTFVFIDNSRGKGVIFFVLDQIVHVISLVIISWLATGGSFRTLFDHPLSGSSAILILLCLIVTAVWVVPILEIELVVAIMPFRQPIPNQKKSQKIEPITISDRIMGSAERLVGLALMSSGLGIVTLLIFLPRFFWLLRRTTPDNRIIAVLKSGTSFVTVLLMGLLLRQVDILLALTF